MTNVKYFFKGGGRIEVEWDEGVEIIADLVADDMKRGKYPMCKYGSGIAVVNMSNVDYAVIEEVTYGNHCKKEV